MVVFVIQTLKVGLLDVKEVDSDTLEGRQHRRWSPEVEPSSVDFELVLGNPSHVALAWGGQHQSRRR